MSVGTTPMIAIPVAAFMGSVAMIVGSTRQVCCNHSGHARPMIAIPTADDCGSLQVGLPPSILEYDIFESDAADWPEPAHGEPDRQNRI